ncbi:MAG: hypothetical protein ABJA82_05355 [Myxococcales bacterium]
MLSTNHRHKLIDSIVIAMGKPKGSASAPPMSKDEGSAEEEDAETPEQEGGEDIQFAKDAARALGMEEMDDEKARAFAEAVKGICGDYQK